jgi:hypothetical protein
VDGRWKDEERKEEGMASRLVVNNSNNNNNNNNNNTPHLSSAICQQRPITVTTFPAWLLSR